MVKKTGSGSQKRRHLLRHILVLAIAVLAAVLFVVPSVKLTGEEAADAASQATVELPDQPSGEFLVLMNEKLHGESMADWETFFTGKDLPVIFDDVSCLVCEGDAAGREMADRYRLQLPENQMQLAAVDPVLLTSKAEAGMIDMAVFSREMADAMHLAEEDSLRGITVIHVTGGDQ